MLAHYHWNLVIYLCYIIRIIVVLTISSLLPYPPIYLIHLKAGPRLQTSGPGDLLSCNKHPRIHSVFSNPCIWTWKLKRWILWRKDSGTVPFQKSSPPPPSSSWIFQVFNVGGIPTIFLQRRPHLNIRRIEALTFQAVFREHFGSHLRPFVTSSSINHMACVSFCLKNATSSEMFFLQTKIGSN